MEPFMSSKPIVEILAKVEPVDAIAIEEPHEFMWASGVAYYGKKPVYILKDRKNGNQSLPPDRKAMFLGREEFRDLWASDRRIALVLERSSVNETAAVLSDRPLKEIGGYGSRLVFVNLDQVNQNVAK